MNRTKIIPQLPLNFKLERNIVIYSRLLAGESVLKLSKIKGYPAPQAIYKIEKAMKKYIRLGVIAPVRPYED